MTIPFEEALVKIYDYGCYVRSISRVSEFQAEKVYTWQCTVMNTNTPGVPFTYTYGAGMTPREALKDALGKIEEEYQLSVRRIEKMKEKTKTQKEVADEAQKLFDEF